MPFKGMDEEYDGVSICYAGYASNVATTKTVYGSSRGHLWPWLVMLFEVVLGPSALVCHPLFVCLSLSLFLSCPDTMRSLVSPHIPCYDMLSHHRP